MEMDQVEQLLIGLQVAVGKFFDEKYPAFFQSAFVKHFEARVNTRMTLFEGLINDRMDRIEEKIVHLEEQFGELRRQHDSTEEKISKIGKAFETVEAWMKIMERQISEKCEEKKYDDRFHTLEEKMATGNYKCYLLLNLIFK